MPSIASVDWARVWAWALLDPINLGYLREDPKKAVEEFNKDVRNKKVGGSEIKSDRLLDLDAMDATGYAPADDFRNMGQQRLENIIDGQSEAVALQYPECRFR